jgi:glycine cleavage system H protein
METLMILVAGLVARLLLFVLLFALFATPIVAAIYVTQAAVALHQRATGTVDAGGARWKPGLAYTTAHTWVKNLWGRNVKVGLDDVARRIVAGATSLKLPPVGTRLRQGDLLVAVRCGNRLVAVPSPVDGVVIERNTPVLSNPSLLEKEPYRAGYLLRIETSGHGPFDAYRGGASKRWLREENLRLTRFLETRLGMAAADGGTLMAPPSVLLSDAAWREAAQSFLKAA